MPSNNHLFEPQNHQRRQDGSLLSALPMLWSCTSSGQRHLNEYSEGERFHRHQHQRPVRQYKAINDENRVNRRRRSNHNKLLLQRTPFPYHHNHYYDDDDDDEDTPPDTYYLLEKYPTRSTEGGGADCSRSQTTATTRTSSASTAQESLKRRIRERYYHRDSSTSIFILPVEQHQHHQHQRTTRKSSSRGGSSTSRLTSNTTLSSSTTGATPSIVSHQEVDTSSLCFADDISFLSFDYGDDDLSNSTSSSTAANAQQLKHWKRQASECFDCYGIHHIKTANAFLELGSAHVRCEQYSASLDFFRSANRFYERTFGPTDLRVAKALDALGVAQSGGASASADKAGLILGLQDLKKCFKIRYQELGPWHIDTVETMNKIANIYMKLRWIQRAKDGFLEVLTMRKAILGEQHPSVAVAAHSLGMAHLRMNEQEQAKAYFLQALNVFALCGLAQHAFADKIREHVTKLGFDESRVEI